MSKQMLKSKALWLGAFLVFLLFGINSSSAAPSLASRLQGQILLQVESLGEAWYVIPKEQQRVYMKDGAVAYQIMREVSLGITNANLAKIPVGIEARFNDVDTDGDGLSDKLEEGLGTDPLKADTDNDGFSDGEEINNNYSPLGPNKLVYDQALVNRLRGYILLQVEKQGQAWYVNPKDGKRYYMQDGPAAYNIMRYLSLGITNANLDLVPKSSRVFNVDTTGSSPSNQNNQGNNNNSTSTPPGNNQGGNSGGGGGGGGGGSSQPSADTQRPSTPANLSATASGTQIALSWTASTDNVGVVGYQILRSTSNGSGYTQIATSNTNAYNNTGLNIGTTYYYIVRAYDAAGNVSLDSSQVQAVAVDNQSPTAPSGLNATATGLQIALSWTASTDNVGVTQYIIERSNSALTGFMPVATSTTSVYTNTHLTVNTTYYYRIKAQDAVGNNSAYSGLASATTNNELVVIDTQRPSTPANLSATASGTQIALSWTASTDNVGVVGYQILRSTSNGSGYTQIATSNTNAYNNTGLNIGTTYYYIVRAYDAAGNVSLDSSQVQATVPIPADTESPTAPSALTATAASREVALSWNASTDNVAVTGYQVLRSTTNGSGYVQQTTVNTTVYVDENLNNGTIYYYVVRAYDAAANVSISSNQAQATPADTQSPTVPSNLTTTVSGTQVSLSWSASTDNVAVSQYLIERSDNNSSSFVQVASSNTTSYTNTSLTNNAIYYYRVRAQDSSNNYSNYSNTASATVGTVVVSGPSISGVSGTLTQGQTVSISGSGFGTKNRQQPLMFDNLVQTAGYQGYLQHNTIVPTKGCIENSTACEVNPQPTNQSLPWHNHWYGGTPRFYIGSSSRYTGHPAYRATNLANTDSRKGFFARDFAINTAEGWTYLDWWMRSNADFGQGPGGIVSGKTLRLWPDANVVDQIVLANIPTPQLAIEMHSCYPSTHTSSQYFSSYPLNQWSHIGVATKVSASGNRTIVTVNGRLVADASDICGGNGIYDYLRMVGLDPSQPEYLASNLEFLWGDVYFDDSLARVVLSNSSTFNPFGGSVANHYEVQNIQSWSNNSVTFKANPGAFSPGQTVYLYVIDSNGSVNTSGYPVTIGGSAQIDTQAPTIPTNLSAVVSGTQASLSWTASTDNTAVTGYQIWRSATSGGPYNTFINSSSVNSYTHTGLSAGTYYYVVKAYDAAGNYSNNSNQVTVQISGGDTSCTPITVTNLTANIGTSNPQNTASVTATAGSVMYLTVGVSFMPSSIPGDSITISGLGATWTKVSTNTFGYRRRVWLFKGVGGSGTGPITINYTGANAASFQEIGWVLDRANGLNLTTPNGSVTTVETGLTSPSLLTVSTTETPDTCDATYSSLALEYQQNTNVESGWSLLGQTSSGSLGVRKVASAWDDARDTSHTWSWVNSSYGTAFITILKNVSSPQTSGDTQAPTIPSNVSTAVSGTNIFLSWTASTDNIGVSRYLVERSISASSGFTQIASPTTNSYNDPGLANSTTYYYRVRAQDAAANTSSYSSTVNATTGSTTPPPAGSVSISGASGTLTQGQTVSISGSGFGTKNRQQSLMFDNLVQTAGYQGYLQHNTIVPTKGCIENSTACEVNPQPTNQSLPWHNHWYGGTPRFYIGSSSRYTGHPAYRATNLANTDSRKGYFARNFAINTSEGWTNLDWWIRSNVSFGEGPGGIVSGKILRLWHHNDIVDQVILVNMPGPQAYVDRGCTVHTGYQFEYFSSYPLNQWVHLNIMTRVTPSGTEAKVLVDGRLVATMTGFCGNDGIYDYIRMLGLDPSHPEYLASNLEFLWGDVYFDDSLARVVLSNSSTFNPFGGTSTNHYEVQNIQSWSNNSVTFKANPGAFSPGQTVYLYVIDSNGSVNTSGYPVTISGVLGTNVSSCNNPDQDTMNWTNIPNGTLVRGCGSSIYAISGGQRIYIPSLEVLRRDYPGQRIYNVSESLLAAYPIVYR